MSVVLSTKSRSLPDPIIEKAQTVIANQINALSLMSNLLSNDFLKAIELLLGVKGKVAVTGMGKSGHISRKVAATLSSTGQPAYFIHPSEASHGDLGMISAEDIVIAFSNSGETKELSDLINYTKRLQVPLIGITRDKESSLAKAATCHIALPNVPEACPLKLAPTTSTTMMLVLGDAIALTLLEMKGFSVQEYGLFHPGGTLGKKLKRVKECMRSGKDIPLVDETVQISEALLEMTSKRIGCVGAINKIGRLVGVFTEGDLRRCMNNSLFHKTLKDVMSPNPITIDGEILMSEALTILNERKITSLFIVENHKPIGFIHIHDFLAEGIL